MNRTNQGFMLLDAALASSVLLLSFFFSWHYSQSRSDEYALQQAMLSLNSALVSGQRKYSLDGYRSGESFDVVGAAAVGNQVRASLNSRNFDACGDWQPEGGDPVGGIELLGCGWVPELPAGYMIAHTVQSYDGALADWYFSITSSTPKHLVKLISGSDKLRHLVTNGVSGGSFKFHGSAEESYLSNAECLDLGVDCVLRIGFAGASYSDSLYDPYLRVDGLNGLLGSLVQEQVECMDEHGQATECGLLWDGQSLDVQWRHMSANSLQLDDSVWCYDNLGNTVSCGIEDVETGTSARFNSAYSTAGLDVYNDDAPILSVGASGVSFEGSAVDVRGGLVSSGLDASGVDVNIHGDAYIDALSPEAYGSISSGAGIYFDKQLIRLELAVLGQDCGPRDLMAMTSGGDLLRCGSDSLWAALALGDGGLPSNSVVYFAGHQCPDGYDRVPTSGESVAFLRRGFSYRPRDSEGEVAGPESVATDAGFTLYGDNTYKLSVTELPSHHHLYSSTRLSNIRGVTTSSSQIGGYATNGYSSFTTQTNSRWGNSFDIEPPNFPLTGCIAK